MTRKLFLLLQLTSLNLFSQQIELVSNDLNAFQNLRDFYISEEFKEAYFTIQSPNQELSQIALVKNNKWKKPILLPFCDNYSYLEPFLSYDCKRLYFASDRPKDKTSNTKSDFDIWYVERKDLKSNWSEPINLGNVVNTSENEFYPTLANNNNLYFTKDSTSGMGKDDIYMCNWNGTSYSEPRLLNKNINSEGYEFNAFISKDESFLLYTKYNSKDGYGSGDLFIAKKDITGEWKTAENLGNIINSKYMEYCPFYDSTSGTLYFTSRRCNLASKKFNSLKDFQHYITSTENGLSKIYKVKINF